ncbi:MAG: DUF1501 domain-containing protein [Gemmatimonadales bacterium]|nr:DUF1501 domain-containing protein [Gemmatimonadales bacterium]
MSDSISRRVFVRGGALGLVSFGLDPLFLGRAAYALNASTGPAAGKRTLVCLFQRGAVDGLNMIVPHGDAQYYRERPRIAIPRNKVVDLDGHFGLHPALAPLKPFWDAGSLAAVHAVGSPDGTRSHFDAQDYMESGTPGRKSTTDGWANRYCQNAREHTDTPFRAVAFGPQLPRIMAGTAPSLAIDDLRSFGVGGRNPGRGGDKLTRAFEALYEGAATGLLATSAEESFEAIRMLKTANPASLSPAAGAAYPRGRLGQSLSQIAQLIKADMGVEIAFADLSGWDTHVNQGNDQGQLAQRLTELGQALAAFATDLGERMSEVCVLTMSEFGRTVRENGTGGTDHGHGTAMLVLGGTVNGKQIAGRWPGLDPAARYEGRDVAVTTDFRDLFREILTRHLGARDLSAVFPGYQVSEAKRPGVIRG